MKPTLNNNLETLKTLRKLKEHGFYIGSIEDSSFELRRNKLPSNYSIKGKLNSIGLFELKAGFSSPMDNLFKTFLIVVIILSLFIYWHFISFIIGLGISSLIYWLHYLRCNKEMNLFSEAYQRCKNQRTPNNF